MMAAGSSLVVELVDKQAEQIVEKVRRTKALAGDCRLAEKRRKTQERQ